MARFSVYAISSLTEGLPITLLEAMRARVPVVATRVGGIPTVLDKGKAGTLVDPGSAAALADGLMAILNNRQLADRLTRHAYVRFSGCYSSQAMANSYVALYRQLIPFGAG
jgi:glycosyltransferase involved in cell wall biosynthesis